MLEVQVLVTGTTYSFSVHYKRMETSSLFIVYRECDEERKKAGRGVAQRPVLHVI
jgi:hypothetical protein